MKTTATKQDVIAVLVCATSLLLLVGAAGNSARRNTKATLCRANLNQWGRIFEAFANDNDGNFNEGFGYSQHYPVQPNDYGLYMVRFMPYYANEKRLLLCPEAFRPFSEVGLRSLSAWQRLGVRTPQGRSITITGSYNINSWTNNMLYDRGPTRPIESFWRNANTIPNPRIVPVLGDGAWNDAWPQHTDSPPPYRGAMSFGTTDEMQHFCMDRHSGAINMLFADFAARKVGLKELWTLKWHRNFDTENPWTKTGGVKPEDWPQWMQNFKDY